VSPENIARALPIRLRARFVGVSWRDLAASLGPIVIVSAAAIWVAILFVQPAPPHTITMASGPEGSLFRTYADQYRTILARSGINLEVLTTEGSLDNLKKLLDAGVKVDVGFVPGGMATGFDTTPLVSLGSVFREPLAVFYRGSRRIDRLSQLAGRRLAIGPEGSGTRVLSLALLKANGIEPGDRTHLVDLSGDEAASALKAGTVDAAFLMGDSATPPIMRDLMRTPGIRLMNFKQADAYTRRLRYLDKLEYPRGSFDLGKNLPAEDFYLIAPVVELVAREDLHPALSDLLIEAARTVHGRAGLSHKAGEFPAPVERELRISDDATRYYKSGKGFLYRYLSFWLASLADRTVLLLLPIIVLVIPGLRLVPMIYGWRIRSRIYRRYGELIAIERSMMANAAPEEEAALLKRLDDVEAAVNKMKMPLAFADQFYVLREHIRFVRDRLAAIAA
jgi:TRAP-type uncharacterized transport system substrate-binding protein